MRYGLPRVGAMPRQISLPLPAHTKVGGARGHNGAASVHEWRCTVTETSERAAKALQVFEEAARQADEFDCIDDQECPLADSHYDAGTCNFCVDMRLLAEERGILPKEVHSETECRYLQFLCGYGPARGGTL